MDELTLIREFVGEPPSPSPRVARAAWELLDQQMHGHQCHGGACRAWSGGARCW
jgi:hypothetical protein